MNMKKKAWVVGVNMGYGHQRTVHPLRDIAYEGKILNANDYPKIPKKDKRIWVNTRRFYEFVSRLKDLPLIGNFLFSLYDKLQKIPEFYPRRDLSKPILSIKKIFSTIEKGWGRDFIERLKKRPLPFVSSFFVSSFMAEEFNYPKNIYCIICDADVSRSWVSLDPEKSRIKYFAPNNWVVNRLKLYGVKDKNIHLTGFPLPKENAKKVKKDLGIRIVKLDPSGEYREKYSPLIRKYLGRIPSSVSRPITILFSIGGAGAQKEMAFKFVKSLSDKIKRGEIKVFLSAGIREEVRNYFARELEKEGLKDSEFAEIIFDKDIWDYFGRFNKALRETDILWTKPSELSFYTALGLPMLLAPPIGSQEDFNRKWLLSLGSGVLQENPKYADQWLIDYLKSGRFAEAAMRGFISAETEGSYNIEKICFGS